jgi:mxaJ protein
MSSRFRRHPGKATIALLLTVVLLVTSVHSWAQDCCGNPVPIPRSFSSQTATGRRILRVAADPNNLPFSNQKLQGFENKIASLIAEELGAEIEYTWRAQRRGFFRETLKEGVCDLVLGVPAGFEMALTTKPYYRSSYVFVSRKDRALALGSLENPNLSALTIGVQLVGDDGANPPAAHALARRGLAANLRGFSVFGDYREENPPARIISAVAAGELDTAVVWGPLAGYFAKSCGETLVLAPIQPERDASGLRFAFSIAMATRKDAPAFRDEINGVIDRRALEITRILQEFGVPLVPVAVQPGKEHEPR